MIEVREGSHRISWRAELLPHYGRVLSPEAVRFVASLNARFSRRVSERLEARVLRQAAFDAGERPEFSRLTRDLRASPWGVVPPPADLEDRRVELTGSVDRKTIINGLNSQASSFMADFEDATTPTFRNMVEGQLNLMDAVRRTLRLEPAGGGDAYELSARPANLFVRPRGLHLVEKHMQVDGAAVPATLFDIGLHVFHNARALRELGTGLYLYLPKLESFLEARLLNDVFTYCERALELPVGTIRATVLIETLPAAFEMDEILFELREHSAGLNFGRWNYVFGYIKKLRSDPRAVLPDRAQLGMDRWFPLACAQLMVRTCHRRGAHAMGGMAAQIPIQWDSEANALALRRVRADKLREVMLGHDGTWVAHPALVPVAREIFDQHMRAPNQVRRLPEFRAITVADLLTVPEGTATEAGLKTALRAGVAYLEAWLGGRGCVRLDDLMEDASTIELARAQVWQWIRHGVTLDNGRQATRNYVRAQLLVETQRLVSEKSLAGAECSLFTEASELFESIVCATDFVEFLTLPAYEALLARGQ